MEIPKWLIFIKRQKKKKQKIYKRLILKFQELFEM